MLSCILANQVCFPSLKVPRSTCRSWLRRGARHVVSTEKPDALEQLATIGRLENRIGKLKAVVRLYAQLARSTRAQLACHRLPDGDDKAQILRAIDAVEPIIGRRGVLRILGLKRRQLWVWRGCASWCQLDDARPYPRTVPARLTTVVFDISSAECVTTSAGAPRIQPPSVDRGTPAFLAIAPIAPSPVAWTSCRSRWSYRRCPDPPPSDRRG